MFVRWPGKVTPHRDDETLAHILDFTTTILDITGAKNPGDLPGLNLMDQEALKARDTVFVEAYTHDIADLQDPAKSRIADVVIEGWWKLIVPGSAKADRPFSTVPADVALFDLKNDPLEKNDLAKEHPEIVAKLKAKLEKL